MKKTILLMVLLAITLVLSTTQAYAFSLAYPYSGPVEIKYDNFEMYLPGYTAVPDVIFPGGGGTNYYANLPLDPTQEILYGVIKIKSIAPLSGGSDLWHDGQDGEEITGYFKDLNGSFFIPVGPLGDDMVYQIGFGAVAGTSPTIFTFLDNTPDFLPDGASAGIAGAPLVPGSAVDGVSFVDILLIPGIISGDPSTLINSSYDTFSDPNKGTGFFLGMIVGGNYASFFGTNVSGQSNINVPPDPIITKNWNTTSFDPMKATIPEPSTILLLGVGLLGLGSVAWRRKRK